MSEQEIIDQLVNVNDKLYGLPGGVLTILFVVVLSVMLRLWKMFPNEHIARWATLIGVGAFLMLAPPRGTSSIQIYIGRNIIIGFIVSAVTCTATLRFGPKLPVLGKYITALEDPDEKPKTEPEKKE